MQVQALKKAKYSIENFINQQKLKRIEITQVFKYCICNKESQVYLKNCSRCGQDYHICVRQQKNLSLKESFQCLKCISRTLDPLYSIKKVLVESFFKTEDIFQYQNIIKFTFNIDRQDYNDSIQVRGLQPSKRMLAWPMQGSLYINNYPTPIFELKPLLSNSNRKNRKEQYISIPKDKIKLGINTLIFKIPCLDEIKFTTKYQYQKKGIYFFGIYTIKKYQTQQLIIKIRKQRRFQKKQSLELLRNDDNQLQIQKNKVNLICPYTKQRIKVPVRGKRCKHFTCVCLETLIANHYKLRTWNCPLCPQRINQPYVDIWFQQILRDNKKGYEVILLLDGTYQWVSKNNQQILSLSDSSKMSIQDPIKIAPKQPHNIEIINQLNLQLQLKDDGPLLYDQYPLIQQKKIKQQKIKNKLEIILSDDDDNLQQQIYKKIINNCSDRKLQKQKKLRTISQQKKIQLIKSKKSYKSSQKHNNSNNNNNKNSNKTQNIAIIFNIKAIDFKELNYSQFKYRYFPYSTKINLRIPQDLKKIFRQIL